MNKNSVESAQCIDMKEAASSLSDNFVTKRKRENNTLYKGKYYDVFILSIAVDPDESKRTEINRPCRSKQEQNQSQTWPEQKLFICLPSWSLYSLAKRVSRIQPHVIQLIRWRADVQKKKSVQPHRNSCQLQHQRLGEAKIYLLHKIRKAQEVTEQYGSNYLFFKKEEGIKCLIENLKG